jgi:hypothetical protein
VDNTEGDTDQAPVVICVNEAGLAISLELTLQALGFSAVVHEPADGLGALPLAVTSTLIVDRAVLPRNPNPFFARMRDQSWRGLAIVLLEDSALPEPVPLKTEGAFTLEKPFVAWELLALVRRAKA